MEDHRRIEGLIDRIEEALDEGCPADLAELSRLRWTLARELFQHLALEERVLAVKPSLGRRAVGRVQSLIHEHHACWTGERIIADWPEYRVAARRLLNAVRARIQHEERDIYPLLH
jgi:iron-sulfur cluster repair protein YtfE (RIC family)